VSIRYDLSGNWILIGRYWYRLSDGMVVPVIQGGGMAVVVQNNTFAFGDDDGSESGHSLDTENAPRTAQLPDITFLIRIQVEETDGGNSSFLYALFAQKNGTGGYTEVTTARTDGLIIANDTQSRADDENTSERLSAGVGAFVAGKYDDGQTQTGTTAIGLDTEYTDLEFAIQIDSANAVDTDYWDLEVHEADGTVLGSYPGTLPRVTAYIEAVDVDVYPVAISAGADSVDPTTQLGDIDFTPTLDDASAVGIEPSVLLGDIDFTPAVAVAGADSIDPTVFYSSMDVSPAVAESVADSVDPSLFWSSQSASPTASAAGADSVGPTVATATVLIPTTDDLRNGWTDEGDGTTNIYQSIDESPYSDSDYIKSSENPSTEIYRTKLLSGSDPSSSDDHVVKYRYKHNGQAGDIDLVVRLKEGGTTRASWNHNNIGGTIVNAEQTLSGAEADSITDYTDLYLEFEANKV
jgi:hypothetical protein